MELWIKVVIVAGIIIPLIELGIFLRIIEKFKREIRELLHNQKSAEEEHES